MTFFLMEAETLVNAFTVNLIRRCKKNDGDAYNQLLSQHEEYLYRICYNYTRSKEEALDMMQEVYIKIFRGIHTFDENRPLLPWLKKITINTLINQGRKNRVEQTFLDPDSYLADKTNIEEEVICRDTGKVINKLIAELPESYRLALTLRHLEEMSYDQIASAIDQPVGTVKSNVYRARNMLREKMQNCELLEV